MALLASSFVAGAQQQKPPGARLSEEQRIVHVLNRLGFGARPGDVERVKALGLERYIEQQLRLETIADAVAESKVERLEALKLTTPELFAKYPQPNQLFRRMEREGKLPPELAALRDSREKGAQNNPQAAGAANQPGAAMSANNENAGKPGANAARPAVNGAADDNKDYRQAVRQYYLQNGLRPPQLITGELQASRILRAVYSERQLQEVLVDFWTNHFNVFAGKGADRWLLVSYDRDTIRPHTMGKFYDLLLETAQSPAMLFYLDNFQSVSPKGPGPRQGQRQLLNGQQRRPLLDPLGGTRPAGQQPSAVAQGANMPGRQQAPPPQQQRQRRGINENYARELMELHTLGVDGGYTQRDVQEVARCFTGWTIIAPRGGLEYGAPDSRAGTFVF
ncbi:MAG TPA: DUF1800 family protein, partial [Pyrinomonadaceae bacterium]